MLILNNNHSAEEQLLYVCPIDYQQRIDYSSIFCHRTQQKTSNRYLCQVSDRNRRQLIKLMSVFNLAILPKIQIEQTTPIKRVKDKLHLTNQSECCFMKAPSLQEKISNCSELVIQQLEKPMSTEEFIQYLKANKLETKLRQFVINNKAKYILLRFNNHQEALAFYHQRNFKDTLWTRPFNIYFNLKLASEEVAKYTLNGLTEPILREVFVIVGSLGICKLYTRYQHKGGKAYLNHSAKLNIIRQQQLSEEEERYLRDNLSKLQVAIEKRRPRDQVQLYNFIVIEEVDKEDYQIICYQSAKKLVKKVYPNAAKTVKKIELTHCISLKSVVPKLEYKAVIECKEREDTLCLFEGLRLQLLKYEDASYVRWNFFQQHSPSYQILFETNLTNGQNLPTKKYQHFLLEQLRRVSDSVVQVHCQQNKRNQQIFNAKIVFDTVQGGRRFLCSYPSYGSALWLPYSAGKGPNFNIWIGAELKMQRDRQVQHKNVVANQQESSAQLNSDQKDLITSAALNFAGKHPIHQQSYYTKYKINTRYNHQ